MTTQRYEEIRTELAKRRFADTEAVPATVVFTSFFDVPTPTRDEYWDGLTEAERSEYMAINREEW